MQIVATSERRYNRQVLGIVTRQRNDRKIAPLEPRTDIESVAGKLFIGKFPRIINFIFGSRAKFSRKIKQEYNNSQRGRHKMLKVGSIRVIE